MMAALLHAAALAPASLPWLLVAARKSHAITLATLRRWRYSSHVPEKKGIRFGSLNYIKAHIPRNAVFLRAFAIVCLLWAAVAGAFGLLVSFGVPVFQPAICRPPRLEAGRGLTAHQGGSHA